MALEIKELDCPNCGSSLSVKNARKAKLLVCHNCGSQIDLTSPEHAIIGKAILGHARPRSSTRLGQILAFDDVEWQVVGRVCYDDEGHWDEWLLMSEDGEYRWLVEDEGETTLYWPFVPTNPVDPNKVGWYLDLEGFKARVTERGHATIEYVEGELTWKARVGDGMYYLDAEYADGVYSIEWSEREIEFFKGRKLSTAGRQLKPIVKVLVIGLAIVLFACLMLECEPTGGGPDGTWPSIRIGSTGGLGGGFGGGK
jgi:hypothetical protein